MKRCPECRRDYYDETLLYCLDDGAALLVGPAEPVTAMLPESARSRLPASEAPTVAALDPRQNERGETQTKQARQASTRNSVIAGVVGIVLVTALGVGSYLYYGRGSAEQIDSIAVMPFLNESGTPDLEYLSDGMTETLIGSLSQIPNLNVKARSSVFRYKGKETHAPTIGRELGVQAILTGRVIQRGPDLTLYVELVEAKSENSLWKQNYTKTMTNLVSLQNDIARDVADRLKVKLTGAVAQKLTTISTGNAEAYQLYLRGRFHTLKNTRQDLLRAVQYFEQATAIDPNYALAYVGLADAYRGLALGGQMRPTEFFPKAKVAARKAIEIDGSLAEAHAILGWIVYWHDWDWAEAERHCRKALELDPNSGDAHLFYAHILSSQGRHDEALAEARRAREAEPLNLRTIVLESQFLIYSGQPDEALKRLQTAIDLDPTYWFAHQFAAAAYIDLGRYEEAVAAASKGCEFYSLSTRSHSYLCFALVKLGKRSEAQAVLGDILKSEDGSFLSPYIVATAYNGLGERDETIKWLERGVKERDPRMIFLKVDPKWNNLQKDPRFKGLLREVGFPE